MIRFRQKMYTEYDAMRSLYLELRKSFDSNRIQIIDSQQLIPVLKGNSVVIEKFVINKSFFGKEKYRLFLKIGAKAKLPENFMLTGKSYNKKLGDISLSFNGNIGGDGGGKKKNKKGGGNQHNNSSYSQENYRLFGLASAAFKPYISLEKTVHEPLGKTIKYDKRTRTVVLEFDTIYDAVKSLSILPIGLDYKLYLLDK